MNKNNSNLTADNKPETIAYLMKILYFGLIFYIYSNFTKDNVYVAYYSMDHIIWYLVFPICIIIFYIYLMHHIAYVKRKKLNKEYTSTLKDYFVIFFTAACLSFVLILPMVINKNLIISWFSKNRIQLYDTVIQISPQDRAGFFKRFNCHRELSVMGNHDYVHSFCLDHLKVSHLLNKKPKYGDAAILYGRKSVLGIVIDQVEFI